MRAFTSHTTVANAQALRRLHILLGSPRTAVRLSAGWSCGHGLPPPLHTISNTAEVRLISNTRSPISGPISGRQLTLQASSSSEIRAKGYQPPTGGFKVHRITGDGSCMFRAIVQGVQMASKGTPMSVQSEATAAQNLRAAVVEELRARKSEMEPFIAGITDDWEDYLERMSHPAAWGGEPEMVMAVNIIRRPITVYRSMGMSVEPIVTYGEELASSTAPIHLLWSGMHYDLLLPTPVHGRDAANAA